MKPHWVLKLVSVNSRRKATIELCEFGRIRSCFFPSNSRYKIKFEKSATLSANVRLNRYAVINCCCFKIQNYEEGKKSVTLHLC